VEGSIAEYWEFLSLTSASSQGEAYACDSMLRCTSVVVFGPGRISITITRTKHGSSIGFWSNTAMRSLTIIQEQR
jgi:hypothetical protein